MPCRVPDVEDEFDNYRAQVYPCPNPGCPLTWSSRAAAEDCCADD